MPDENSSPSLIDEAIDFFRVSTPASAKKTSSSKDGLRSVFESDDSQSSQWELRTECIETSKAHPEVNSVLTAGYFTVTKSQPKVPASRQPDPDGTFWQIIVLSMSEEHEEKFSLQSTLCDSVVVYATGAKPVSITISGYVLYSKTDDHAYLFLRNYVEYFRTRKIRGQNSDLHFVLKDTEFDLLVENITLGHAIEFETYVGITVSGLAYHYKMTNSTEYLYQGYDGRGRSVAASKRDLLEADEESEDEAGQEEKGDVFTTSQKESSPAIEPVREPGARTPATVPFLVPQIDPAARAKVWAED